MRNEDEGPGLTRRRLLKLAVATPLAARAAASPVAAAQAAAKAAFFTAAELQVLDELTELILPADEHSPGARVAGVARHIDGRLAEHDPAFPELREVRERWKAGIQAIDALSREMNGAPFLETSEEKRVAVLERLASVEKPASVAETFFPELKRWTARGYYTSKVGIHQELEYRGNSLLAEFVGVLPE
jgi:hypothetical protein